MEIMLFCHFDCLSRFTHFGEHFWPALLDRGTPQHFFQLCIIVGWLDVNVCHAWESTEPCCQVFEVLRKGTRKDVVRLVEEKDVTLGMVDPTSGRSVDYTNTTFRIFSRSLMYKLLTTVTNGDKIVLGE